ncbi:MAG: hypothetical protein WC783_00765 [Candidatus Paceibacterota bacterium]|jgi:hypothetical protein
MKFINTKNLMDYTWCPYFFFLKTYSKIKLTPEALERIEKGLDVNYIRNPLTISPPIDINEIPTHSITLLQERIDTYNRNGGRMPYVNSMDNVVYFNNDLKYFSTPDSIEYDTNKSGMAVLLYKPFIKPENIHPVHKIELIANIFAILYNKIKIVGGHLVSHADSYFLKPDMTHFNLLKSTISEVNEIYNGKDAIPNYANCKYCSIEKCKERDSLNGKMVKKDNNIYETEI